MKAAEKYQAQAVLIGGGVSANKNLRQGLKEECAKRGLIYFIPDPRFSMDNAAMIALIGALSSSEKEVKWKNIRVNANAKL